MTSIRMAKRPLLILMEITEMTMEQYSAQKLTTPCFVFDEDEFERSVRGFQKALDNNFKRGIIGYSVKTNSLPYILAKVKELGCYAEVVSHDEYELARIVGFPVDKIIYNGPMKSEATFLEAVRGGAIVNIETLREIDWLKKLPANDYYRIGIRLNIDINKISPEDAKNECDFSRFGFSDQTDDFCVALKHISEIDNVRIAGLHIHRMSATRSVRYYENLVKYACEVIGRYGLKLDYIDVGGGYFGFFPKAPTYKDYSDAFYRSLRDAGLESLTVIVEPGTALVASAMAYESTVIDIKNLPQGRIVVTDGTRNDVDPLFTKKDYIRELFHEASDNAVLPLQIVSGSSCMEPDRLFELRDHRPLNVGDRIRYRNVGSYTMCLSPNFINYLPMVYAKSHENYSVIRDRWTAADVIAKSVLG